MERIQHRSLTRLVALSTFVAAATFAAPLTAAAQDADSLALQRGRELTQRFYDGDLESVVAGFNEQARAALGGAERLSTFRDQVVAQLGGEVEIIDERVTTSGAHRVYHRSARFEKFGAAVAVVWSFDADGRVAGFFVRPEASQQPAASRFLDYETRTPLRLPFDDEWVVVWGGRSVAENYHAAHTDQRFAYDLLIVDDGLGTHRGDGRVNEDYYCFGRAILSPGDGVVVSATDGVHDNVPGELNSAAPAGNHIVIDHGNDEHSLLAHFRQNSIRVSAGDRVAAGDTLGECGNSGRSSEAHLHYHLQNAPEFGRGEGLPAQFLEYIADDSFVARGEPVRGQRIRAAGPRSGFR